MYKSTPCKQLSLDDSHKLCTGWLLHPYCGIMPLINIFAFHQKKPHPKCNLLSFVGAWSCLAKPTLFASESNWLCIHKSIVADVDAWRLRTPGPEQSRAHSSLFSHCVASEQTTTRFRNRERAVALPRQRRRITTEIKATFSSKKFWFLPITSNLWTYAWSIKCRRKKN